MKALEERLKAEARRLAFDLVGIAPAVSPPGLPSFRAWLDAGHAGEMAYMHRQAGPREDPRFILPGVRSVVMAGMNYKPPPPQPRAREERAIAGRVSCYASGEDYHAVLRQRLHQLLDWLRAEAPDCRGRAVVDSAPLLERDFARLAGLGWFGKNTMLLNKRLGSFFFLGALLVSIELQPDPPMEANHCGTCTACLDACPTQAFVAPGQLDARRCISYLTIELRSSIPRELREPMGDWIFGCDICQDVCPWNRKAPSASEPRLLPREELQSPDLLEWVGLSPAEFRARFRDTALSRPRRAGLLRNVAIALGNSGDARAVPALIDALDDESPLVREAAAWALGKVGGDTARAALEKRLAVETVDQVRSELSLALLPHQQIPG
jgi:epoxyqueuosine reductase